jgi:hypothetical protein
VAEDPLRRLARLAGGVVLTHGRLGHQVLGQLLLADSGDVVIAGAAVALAATGRHRSAVAQAALRTAVPALAVRAYYQRLARRLDQKAARLEQGKQAFAGERTRLAHLEQQVAGQAEDLRRAEGDLAAERRELLALQKERQSLQARLEELLHARPIADPPPAAPTARRGGRRQKK